MHAQKAKTVKQSTTYRLEKDIPIPETGRELKYPLLRMEIGDSFTVPLNEGRHVRGAIARVQRVTNKAFSFCTRTIHTKGKAGKHMRVWRITK